MAHRPGLYILHASKKKTFLAEQQQTGQQISKRQILFEFGFMHKATEMLVTRGISYLTVAQERCMTTTSSALHCIQDSIVIIAKQMQAL